MLNRSISLIKNINLVNFNQSDWVDIEAYTRFSVKHNCKNHITSNHDMRLFAYNERYKLYSIEHYNDIGNSHFRGQIEVKIN